MYQLAVASDRELPLIVPSTTIINDNQRYYGNEDLLKRISDLEHVISEMRLSTSWRMTKPIRYLKQLYLMNKKR